MVDKGFLQIKTDLFKRRCTLIMPPFAFNSQLTIECYEITSVRIHVERAKQRIRIFKILQHINMEMLPKLDKNMHVACISKYQRTYYKKVKNQKK